MDHGSSQNLVSAYTFTVLNEDKLLVFLTGGQVGGGGGANNSLVPRPRRGGGKSGLVPIACACAKYPNKTWGSEYDRIFSAFPTSICQ